MTKLVWDPSRSVLPRGEYVCLKAVAQRLATAYPPDWLERCGARIYGAAILACLVLAWFVAVRWSVWWAYLIPAFGPLLLAGVIPLWLCGREPGRPRWAHPKALVHAEDVALIGRIVGRLEPALQARFARHCPATSGDRFFHIWRHLRHAEVEHAG